MRKAGAKSEPESALRSSSGPPPIFQLGLASIAVQLAAREKLIFKSPLSLPAADGLSVLRDADSNIGPGLALLLATVVLIHKGPERTCSLGGVHRSGLVGVIIYTQG